MFEVEDSGHLPLSDLSSLSSLCGHALPLPFLVTISHRSNPDWRKFVAE
jgi:hypothetical protein